MARKVRYTCRDVADPFGRCRDFSPSWDQAERGPPLEKINALLDAIEEYTGNRPTVDTTLRSLEITAGEIPFILSDANWPRLEGVELQLLATSGTVGDLIGLWDQKAAYQDYIQMCRSLQGDEAAFREAGCKREAHVVIPRGRMSFVEPKSYHPRRPDVWAEREPFIDHGVTGKTTTRWADMEPPLDARTQSPLLRGPGRLERAVLAVKSAFDLYVRQEKDRRFVAASRDAEKSQQGLRQAEKGLPEWTPEEKRQQVLIWSGRFQLAQRILAEIGNFGRHAVWMSGKPSDWQEAGLPLGLGREISYRLGNRWIPAHPELQSDRVTEIEAVLGGFRILVGTGKRDAEAYIDLGSESGVDLRHLREPARSLLRPVLAKYRIGRRKELPIQRISVLGGSTPGPIPLDQGEETFRAALNARTRTSRDWTIRLELGSAGTPPTVLDLQHSVLLGRGGGGLQPDYNTWEGFAFSELPPVIARYWVSPRTKRTGRRTKPFPSRV